MEALTCQAKKLLMSTNPDHDASDVLTCLCPQIDNCSITQLPEFLLFGWQLPNYSSVQAVL